MTNAEIKTIIDLIEDKIQEHENFNDCEYSVFEYIGNLRNIADKLERKINNEQ
jgi:glutamine synthetase type III